MNNVRYWDRLGTNVVIQRFPVPSGTNAFTVAIQAVDQAGNTNQATQTWAVNTSLAMNAPNLLSANISQTMMVPAVASIWVEGDVDNPYALITAISAAASGDVATNSLGVLQQHYGGSVPLELGTNQLALIASDAAGNATSNLYTIISVDNYQAAITSPALGAFASSPSTVVNGYVSGTVNSGQPTEADVTGVLINGVAAAIDWDNQDENGNVPFATTNSIPLGVPITGQVLTNSDGEGQPFDSAAIPLLIPPAPAQQYQVVHQEWHKEYIQGYGNGEYAVAPTLVYETCDPACIGEWWSTMDRTTQDDVIDTNGPTEQYQQALYAMTGTNRCVVAPQPEGLSLPLDSSSSWTCVGTTQTTNGVDSGSCSVALSSYAFFGTWSIDGSGNFPASCGPPWDPYVTPQNYNYQGLQLSREWDRGVVSFLSSSQYGTNTPVLFTFEGMNYMQGGGAALDLSQVTWRGYSPAAWSNDAQTVSYLVSLTPNQQYTLNQDSFSWPSSTYGTVMSDAGVPFAATVNAHWLQWTNFYGKYPVRIIWQNADITDTTTNSVIVGQQVSLQAVVDPSLPTTSNFTWSVAGAVSNYVVAFDSSSAQVLPLTQINNSSVNFYWVGGGQQMATCTVVLANGTPVSVYAGFTVQQPDESILATAGTVTLDATYGGGKSGATEFLHFGNGGTHSGMIFTNFSRANLFGGSNFWAQVINSSYLWYKCSDGTCSGQTVTASLDNVYPYASSPGTEDSPGLSLFPTSVAGAATNTSFTMWLMYQPPLTNSIPVIAVPIASVNWSWSGNALLTDGGWTLISAFPISGPMQVPSYPTTNFPQWNTVANNSNVFVPVPCAR